MLCAEFSQFQERDAPAAQARKHLGAADNQVEDIIIDIHKRTEFAITSGPSVSTRAKTVFFEIPAPFTAVVITIKTTRPEILMFLPAAIAAFSILSPERPPSGKLLPVLAPIIHVKPALLCA